MSTVPTDCCVCVLDDVRVPDTTWRSEQDSRTSATALDNFLLL